MTETTQAGDTTRHLRDDVARRLLDEAFDDRRTRQHIPAPAPVEPGSLGPLLAPEGYTVRETHRTHADGSTELIREFVPAARYLESGAAAVADGVAYGARRLGAPPPAPAAVTKRHALPQWLTANRRRLKISAYAAGAAGATTVGLVYGTEIAAGVTAAAAAVVSAATVVLKFVAAAVVLCVVARWVATPSRHSRTGTFEGTVKGTWRQD